MFRNVCVTWTSYATLNVSGLLFSSKIWHNCSFGHILFCFFVLKVFHRPFKNLIWFLCRVSLRDLVNSLVELRWGVLVLKSVWPEMSYWGDDFCWSKIEMFWRRENRSDSDIFFVKKGESLVQWINCDKSADFKSLLFVHVYYFFSVGRFGFRGLLCKSFPFSSVLKVWESSI